MVLHGFVSSFEDEGSTSTSNGRVCAGLGEELADGFVNGL